jgi:hypothetical protein
MKRAVLLSLALLGCDKAPLPGPPAASAEPVASAPAPVASAPAPTASATVKPEPTARVLSPPAGSVSREDREKAALDLLSGRLHAADLPLSDVDQGQAFEPDLRFAMGHPMKVEVKDVVVAGLDEKAVRAAVEPILGRIRVCYAGGLKRNPNLQGRIAVRLRTNAQGKPSHVENGGSEVPDSAVVACVVKQAATIELPAPTAPEGVTTVSFLLTFL